MAVLNQMSVLDMIKAFRRNWRGLCNSERTTLCGPDAMLLALQLSMAENNKQHNGEFTVCLSDVLLTWKYFLHEKLNLPIESMKVVDHYEDIKKTYDDFLKNSNMLDLIDVYKKCSILTSTCENNMITSIQLRDFLSGSELAVNDETNAHIPASPVKCTQNDEQVRLLAKRIFFSYLSLLVNSKNDLALAHILNIPDRGLGRAAFTSLKHAAREKQLSMFLMATSFIRTVELGGKGYAPSPADPLWAHAKGLSDFIHFIDKLDEILSEIPSPSLAGGRILSVIKMQLIKGHSSEDPFYKAVEEVVQDLNLRIKNIISSQEDVAVSSTSLSPALPKSFAINHDTAYCGRDAVKILLVLLDEDAASAPTRNRAELLHNDGSTVPHHGPSLLTLFRSPTQVNNTSIKPLRERIHKSLQTEKNKMRQTLIRSQFACTYKDDYIMSKNKWNINLSSKPLCASHLENEVSEGVPSSVGRARLETSSENVHLDRSRDDKILRKSMENKISKRKQIDFNSENICCDDGNEPYQHKNVKIPKVPNDSHNKAGGKLVRGAKGNRCTAKYKLIPGQTTLSQFFRL
ncbi:PCNA-interacting partner isoform X1 [Meriones unguiculatus]|uniref:PCNA-interacting partner isoform X1 n=1 Tax=Meriones unguiculatus TaxID=10047 RepID=UPI000B4F0E96|nr:PCNA-interacting partner isoform X1 [Meriones unguiculatus]XP_021482594.1 PCNA-interacting partner isoform X1 [Meriones unguiculatus]